MKTRIATVVVVLATAACTQHTAAPPQTTVAPTDTPTHWLPLPGTAAVPTPTTTWTTPALGPSSALVNVKLPEGSTLVSNKTTTVPEGVKETDEVWRYTVTYDDAVRAMDLQLGWTVVTPQGNRINRCTNGVVTYDYHQWLYVGGLASIQVLARRAGFIDISYEVPVTATEKGCKQ